MSASISKSAESWTLEHTFQDTFNNIVFDGETFSCFSYSNIVQSSDFRNWSFADNDSGVSGVFYLDNDEIYLGTFVLYTNSSFSFWSKKSSDAIHWGSPALIDDPGPSGSLMQGNITVSANRVLFASKSNLSSGLANPYSSHRIFSYDAESNNWNETSSFYIWSSSFDLFSDGESYYFTCDELNAGNWSTEYKTLKSTDGSEWSPFCEKKIEGAYCYDGLIFHSDEIYSPGGGWQSNNWSAYPTFSFNGSRMVAADSSNLLYSDDFGETWNKTLVGEVSSASIIEADQKYVALISTSTNSSIYTLDAYPDRTTVTEIQGFGTTTNGLNFQSTSNGLYQLECTASLIDLNWKAYGLPRVGTGGGITIDPTESLSSNIFFRVRAINN